MAYSRIDHPIVWEVTHHPVIAIVVAMIVAAALLSIVLAPGAVPPEMTGTVQVP